MYSRLSRSFSTLGKCMNKNKAIFIVGTTGVGKTKLSIELAKKFNGEIINADVMQMYTGVNVATAKATMEERDGIPHHLLDYVNPKEEITIHDFHDKALDIISLFSTLISSLNQQGKLPIVVGGTHYYIQSLIWDSLLDIPERNDTVVDIKDMLDEKSTEELYALLQDIDPDNVHHPNQRKKILSDLRLYNQTKVPPSQLRQKQNASRNYEEQLDNLVIWLSCSPDVLSKRLAKRVDGMVSAGMLEENAKFIKRFFHDCDHDRGVWQAIGLKEFVPLFKTENGAYNGRETLSAEEPEVKEALSKVITDTEQYAKRQITWIRNRLESRVKHLIKLDTSFVDQWDQVVSGPAENSVSHLLDGTLPDVQINHTHWNEQSVSYKSERNLKSRRNKKFNCSVCNKVVIGEEQWNQHIRGRVHKRHVESLKRKEMKEKYFEKKEKSVE